MQPASLRFMKIGSPATPSERTSTVAQFSAAFAFTRKASRDVTCADAIVECLVHAVEVAVDAREDWRQASKCVVHAVHAFTRCKATKLAGIACTTVEVVADVAVAEDLELSDDRSSRSFHRPRSLRDSRGSRRRCSHQPLAEPQAPVRSSRRSDQCRRSCRSVRARGMRAGHRRCRRRRRCRRCRRRVRRRYHRCTRRT